MSDDKQEFKQWLKKINRYDEITRMGRNSGIAGMASMITLVIWPDEKLLAYFFLSLMIVGMAQAFALHFGGFAFKMLKILGVVPEDDVPLQEMSGDSE